MSQISRFTVDGGYIQSMEGNVGGEVEVERGEDAGVPAHTGMKATKGKGQAMEETGKDARKGEEGSEGKEGEYEGVSKGAGVGASMTIDLMDMLCNDVIFVYCQVIEDCRYWSRI